RRDPRAHDRPVDAVATLRGDADPADRGVLADRGRGGRVPRLPLGLTRTDPKKLWRARDGSVGGLTPHGNVTDCPQARDRFAPPACGRSDTVLTRGLTPNRPGTVPHGPGESAPDRGNRRRSRPVRLRLFVAGARCGCGSRWVSWTQSPAETSWPRSGRISGGNYRPLAAEVRLAQGLGLGAA